jgi:hypothetical protein
MFWLFWIIHGEEKRQGKEPFFTVGDLCDCRWYHFLIPLGIVVLLIGAACLGHWMAVMKHQ